MKGKYIILVLLIICASAVFYVNSQKSTLDIVESSPQKTMYTPKAAFVLDEDVDLVTINELKTHNFKTDCWVVYEDTVYDITSWIPRETDEIEFKDRVGGPSNMNGEYKGTSEIILRYCGKESGLLSELDRKGYRNEELRMLDSYNIVGKLA